MLKEHFFVRDELSLNYAEGPKSGDTLILLPGAYSRWQIFLPLIPSLILRYHVIAIDFRGRGKSSYTPGNYAFNDHVDDIIDFIKKKVSDQVIIFGHVFGALVALMTAFNLPKKVKAVIIGDVEPYLDEKTYESSENRLKPFLEKLLTISNSKGSLKRTRKLFSQIHVGYNDDRSPVLYSDVNDEITLLRMAKNFLTLDSEILRTMIEDLYSLESYKKTFKGLFKDENCILSSISCPILLMQGEIDDQAVERALKVLPDAYTIKIDKFGQSLGLYEWSISPLIRAITVFLDSVL